MDRQESGGQQQKPYFICLTVFYKANFNCGYSDSAWITEYLLQAEFWARNFHMSLNLYDNTVLYFYSFSAYIKTSKYSK